MKDLYFYVIFLLVGSTLGMIQVDDPDKHYLFDTAQIDDIRFDFCGVNRSSLQFASRLVFTSATRHQNYVKVGMRRQQPDEIEKEIPRLQQWVRWYKARGDNYDKEITALNAQLALIKDSLNYIYTNGYFNQVIIRRLKNCNEYYYEYRQKFRGKPKSNRRKAEINWEDNTPKKTNYLKGTYLPTLDTWYQVCFDEALTICSYIGHNLYYVE